MMDYVQHFYQSWRDFRQNSHCDNNRVVVISQVCVPLATTYTVNRVKGNFMFIQQGNNCRCYLLPDLYHLVRRLYREKSDWQELCVVLCGPKQVIPIRSISVKIMGIEDRTLRF
jgi:hypothetical protein